MTYVSHKIFQGPLSTSGSNAHGTLGLLQQDFQMGSAFLENRLNRHFFHRNTVALLQLDPVFKVVGLTLRPDIHRMSGYPGLSGRTENQEITNSPRLWH